MLNESARTQVELASQGMQQKCVNCGTAFLDSGIERHCDSCRLVKDGTSGCGALLTYRERQIVRLIQNADTNKEISAKLGLSYGTTKQYICAIFRKVGVRNRTQLAIRRDLLDAPAVASAGASTLGSSFDAQD